MNDSRDPWYVRFPDGRVIKAKSTSSLRHHLESGNIPKNALVRRDKMDEWQELQWVREFADLFGGISKPPEESADNVPQLDPSLVIKPETHRLQSVGLRGMIDELLTSLESAWSKPKLIVATLGALLLFIGHFLIEWVGAGVLAEIELTKFSWMIHFVSTGWMVLTLAIVFATLAKLTFHEVSTLKHAKLSDGLQGFPSMVIQVGLACLIGVGIPLVLIFLLGKVPSWIGQLLIEAGMSANTLSYVMTPIVVIAKLIALPLWLIVGMAWILPSAVIVEEGSFAPGLAEWRKVLRHQLDVLVGSTGFAILLALAVSIPISIIVSLALSGGIALFPSLPHIITAENLVMRFTHTLLSSLATIPFIAALATSATHVYLNLRYERNG